MVKKKDLNKFASKASKKAKRLQKGAAKSCRRMGRSEKVAVGAGILSVAVLSALLGRLSK